MKAKFFTIFTILIVLLATFVSTVPVEKCDKVIHVPSPGCGPFARKSTQVVSWWCVKCKPHDDVTVRILQVGSDCDVEVFKGHGNNAFSGSLSFKIGAHWNVHKKYFAEVTLKNDPDIVGKGVEFGIFKTQ
ncbi:hypothetical protein C1645_735535 [Glomus cerebriforme]|uniref:Uncharacterized protein n=1 Tax=Glomus cerebriforme TaxID=658196 RepID=A0A397T4Z6_9GLOM|nr:hypothetical protein C1645_735535 [Glomus cerebriforme]